MQKYDKITKSRCLLLVMGRVPENPTRGFFTSPNPTRTRKIQTQPENPKKPEILEK